MSFVRFGEGVFFCFRLSCRNICGNRQVTGRNGTSICFVNDQQGIQMFQVYCRFDDGITSQTVGVVFDLFNTADGKSRRINITQMGSDDFISYGDFRFCVDIFHFTQAVVHESVIAFHNA